jgi:undecaprenyl-diphosphatase
VEAIGLLLGAVAVLLAVHVVKAAVDRPRPPHPLAGATLSAFPSGHAAYSTVYVALALTATRVLDRLASRATLVMAAIAVAAAIGASRVYLRVHWFSDVVAGWALGAAIFGLVAAAGLVVSHFRNNGPTEPVTATDSA